MQRIEDFMHELFEEHANVERAKLAAYREFRDRFFVEAYEPFNNHEFRHSCEAEKLESITDSGAEAVVTTSTVLRSLRLQYRYYLQARGEKWVVSNVESSCPICDGTGRFPHERQCSHCTGTGWLVLAA